MVLFTANRTFKGPFAGERDQIKGYTFLSVTSFLKVGNHLGYGSDTHSEKPCRRENS